MGKVINDLLRHIYKDLINHQLLIFELLVLFLGDACPGQHAMRLVLSKLAS